MSKTREEVLTFMRWFAYANDYPPTIEEIAHGVGLKSTSSVHAHIRKLEEEGLVEQLPGRRGYRPVRVSPPLEDEDGGHRAD